MAGKFTSKYFRWTHSDLKELIPHNFEAFLGMFSSLSSRNFRLYFFGQIISLCGSWIQSIAMGWLVYRITGSVMMLSVVVFVNQIPSLIVTPFAGVLSDRFNRYRIIFVAQVVYMMQAFTIGTLVLTGVISQASDVWLLICLSSVTGLTAAIEAPSRQAFYTSIVPRKDMTNAIALNSVTINGSRFIGPTIGGILIAMVGEGWCFIINGFSYIAVLTGLALIRLEPYVPKKATQKILSSLKEGFIYIRSFMPLKAVILCIAALSFFGMPLIGVIPALVKDVLRGDSVLLGYLESSIGAGALCAAFYLASRKRVQGLGKVLTITGTLLGLSMVVMSFTRNPVVACIVAFPMGFSLIGSAATANTLLQAMVEDSKRGRVMSFFTMAFTGMTPIGTLVYGWAEKYTSLPVIILVAGIVCVVAGAVYEYFRPAVRAAAHDSIAQKSKVVPEIAKAIGDPVENPF